MLSIGITICDKDCYNLELLLSQIEEKVKCEHEVIIVDNREQLKDVKFEWKPTFQFGYNAFQFASRAKIVELAKGDYIWFIDGDDEIGEVKDFDYTEDVVVFSYNTYPAGSVYFDPEVKDNNYIKYEIIPEIAPVLWNKFIKKDLFSKKFIDSFGNKKIVHCEDTVWLYEVLTHAKSMRFVKDLIYYHKEGLSNKLGKLSIEELKSLTIGFNDVREIITDFFGQKASSYLNNTYHYLGERITKTEDTVEATKVIMDLIPKECFKDVLQDSVYPRCETQEQLQTIIKTVKERYGEEYPFKEVLCKVTYEDGHTEDYKFLQTIDFDESRGKYLNGKWSHNLSIICLVYDGNIQFLHDCTSMIEKNVHIEHEVIIVDNRDDKKEKLDYVGEAIVVDAGGNKGILDGRRLGFEASKNDYIWFIDIDDYVLEVQDKDYGENDILCFPFFYGGEQFNMGKRIIPDTEFFINQTMWKIRVLLWNKWFSRTVLERAYQDIPHFFCVYNEDNIVTFTALKYSRYVECFEGDPIYSHIINEASVTLRTVKEEKEVDTIFVGNEEAIKYFEDNFDLSEELACNSLYVILFYLDIMDKADDCILEYFAQKMIKVFGIDKVRATIKLCKEQFDKKKFNRIKSYFNYEETK